jgi:hypothetical protein
LLPRKTPAGTFATRNCPEALVSTKVNFTCWPGLAGVHEPRSSMVPISGASNWTLPSVRCDTAWVEDWS